MKTLLIISIFLLTTNVALAQDTVELLNGENLKGKVTIEYSERMDYILLNGEKYQANDISSIRLGNGASLYSRDVTYYSKEENLELKKNVFLKEVLVGDVNLYAYDGNEFDFALSSGEQTRVLQDLSAEANTSELFVYRIELINAFGDCVPRQDIYDSSLNKNRLIYLVNTYNLCMNSSYQPLIEPEKKNKVKYIGGSLGTNIEDISYKRLTISRGNVGGDINISEKKTPDFELRGFVYNNIGNSENLFIKTAFSLRAYKFNIDSVGVSDIKIENNNFTEVNLSFGASYRKNIAGPISFDITSGPYLWLLAPSTIKYKIRVNSGYKTAFENKVGFGLFVSSNIYFSFNEKTTLFFGVNRNFLGAESTEENRSQGRLALSAGISIRMSKVGFF